MSRDFDGADDVIDFEEHFNYTANALTLCVWIFPDTFGAGDRGRILDKTTGGAGYGLVVNNNVAEATAALQFFVTNNAFSNNSVINTGVWQHVAATYDGANVRFYVNGVAQGAPAFTDNLSSSTDSFWVGNRADGTRGFDGRMAELAGWTAVLSLDDVVAVMNQGPLSRPTNLLFYIPFCQQESGAEEWLTKLAGSLTGTSPAGHPPDAGSVCIPAIRADYSQFPKQKIREAVVAGRM